MQNLGPADIAVAVVIGGIIVYALVRRWHSLGAKEFYFSMKVTTCVFAAFAIGICILVPDMVAKTAKSVAFDVPIAILSFIALPVLIVFYTDRFLNGLVWLLPKLAAGALSGFLVYPALLNARLVLSKCPIPMLPNGLPDCQLSALLFFVIVIVGCGIAHGFLGPILSAFNVALIVSTLWQAQRVVPSLPDVSLLFDFLSQIGIRSHMLKWVILVLSTTLGVSEFIKRWLDP